MDDLQAALAALVSDALTAEFGADYIQTDPQIRPSAFADYQSSVALALAKRLGRQPREVAERIAGHLTSSPMCARAEVSGPCFINITLDDSWLGDAAAAQLADPRLGVPRAEHPQRVVVDYSGPNVAKELHAGHLRATGVGDAIVRVLEHLGHTVIRAAHLGDWGTQFGMLIEHATEVGEQATYDQLSAGEFTDFYQAANEKFRSNPAFADRSRRRVVELQAGEEQSLRLWHLLVTDSMEYLRKLYARLHITLTDADMDPESFYNPMLPGLCDDLQAAGLAVISDGALCVFPPGFLGRDGSPLPLILRKSDGGYGYAATDVAAIRYRLLDLHADRIIYVVGSEQQQHLAMVIAVARQAGWLTEASAEHAVIGLMTGPGGQRLRTRSGGQFKLTELIDEAVERAEEVIKDRYDDPDLRAQIAEDVGVGALKYGDLSVTRSSSYVLDFDPARIDRQHGPVPPVRDSADPLDLQSGGARAGRRRGAHRTRGVGRARAGAAAARFRQRGRRDGADRRTAQAGRVPLRHRQRLHDLLRAMPGHQGRKRGVAELAAGAGLAHAEGAARRARPARHPGTRPDVTAGRAGRSQTNPSIRPPMSQPGLELFAPWTK